VQRKAGFTPAVTYVYSKRLIAKCHSEGVPRGRPASPVLSTYFRSRRSTSGAIGHIKEEKS